MSSFAILSAAERAAAYAVVTQHTGIATVIVEKDFWVCWLLGRIFDNPAIAPHLVFKGGTSLSLVFQAIQRFSEDVDLSVSPASLGFQEADLDEAPSKSKRGKLFEKLQAACATVVADKFQRELENTLGQALGARSGGRHWLNYQLDPHGDSPVLLFEYPSTLSPGDRYIQPLVKLEFGSLTDQRPTGTHTVKPLLADVIPAFQEEREEVVAMEVERTFWEKATILHSEFHRPAVQPIRDRFARHYSDMAALWRHPSRKAALERLDLLDRVARFKSRFFASSWSDYESARPGRLKLCPPAEREVELARDYAKMAPMFLAPPPPFADILNSLREAEREINAR